MTGRGSRNYLHYPSETPAVTISLSIAFSPPRYDPSSLEPLYIVLSSKILTIAHPTKPITLATWNNPFASLSNRSFSNITHKSNPKKEIQIRPVSHWPKYGPRGLNVREFWNFITLIPGETLEIRHEVPQERILAANVVKGEIYHVAVTELALGTSWWMYGSMEDAENKKFMRWSEKGVEGLKKYQKENIVTSGEPLEDEVWENNEEWIMGQDPQSLRIVVEGEGADFEVI